MNSSSRSQPSADASALTLRVRDLESELNRSWLEWFRAVDHLRGFAEAHNDDITTETLAIFYMADQARHTGDIPADPRVVELEEALTSARRTFYAIAVVTGEEAARVTAERARARIDEILPADGPKGQDGPSNSPGMNNPLPTPQPEQSDGEEQ